MGVDSISATHLHNLVGTRAGGGASKITPQLSHILNYE